MELTLQRCSVRSWRESDAEDLARHANNRAIWLNLRDAFPHPYALGDAHAFIALARSQQPERLFAIAVADRVVGSIGLALRQDVERISAELGYFLGEEYWGRGITSEAVRGLTQHAFRAFQLMRVYALPYAHNTASARVLAKAGFVLEGRLRKSAVKDGRVVDQLLFACVAPDPGPA